ncbi:phosphate/phosphite/phosphonate ABC transporter substrate-binding protein [Paenibacillus sp. J5C_2022]|uniref:phosphate/phosphite/phosphonate ABC transporter substrate-binding protein n=1 Tax=Paenibacillus sp. J5C2022 TaxID=2977129 RepID=UPI0021D15DDD|nr:phosphate/phosphite/phosphonate ABC transporter substrate-binding protein [Paenibacillus sp. J5C2022]MCU6710183.1 phosphate/phosphite/phosphonate ABC transporter substrate-binding protein [Paenibacillus sp. J5C2022]
MKKTALVILALLISVITACGNNGGNEKANQTEGTAAESNGSAAKEGGKLTMVWLPNESGGNMKEARDQVGAIIEQATGKKVEHKTTTDYIIAVESIANGSADLAYLGPQGYVEARSKNDKVEPLVVNSGKSGTLDDAMYYSWLAVKKGNEDAYKQGDAFSIDNIQGKRFSFVSNSSTSGFKVPTASIISHFSAAKGMTELEVDDLVEGGNDKFFSQVSYGGSHQGSAVNLLSDKVDVAAFCDTCVTNYVELLSGDMNATGSEYKVKADADAPFNTVAGEEFVVISSTPVLNQPIVVNSETVSAEDIGAITEALTSDETAKNEKIFVPKDSEFKGIFKQEGESKFLKVEDAWFNPIRELTQVAK